MAELLPYLPHVNAALNGTAFLLVVAGVIAIRRRRERLHKRLMLAAVGASTLFLVSYLVYHWHGGMTRYQGQGWMRTLYFAILLTHTPLAAVQVPLIVVTLVLGWRDRRQRHRWWARITYPIWMYVSVTGVLVYLFLYRF